MGPLTNVDLVLIANCFPNLEELDFSFPRDYPKILYKLVNFLQQDIEYENDFNIPVRCSGEAVEYFFKEGVKALASGLPKLGKVNLSDSYLLRDPLLLILCKNCVSLEELVLGDVDCRLSLSAIANAIHERPDLRSLSVINLANWFGSDILNSGFIDALVSLKGLTCLDLSYGASDDLLVAVAEKGLPLRKLVLRGCSGCCFHGIPFLLRKCNLLQHLDLGGRMSLEDQYFIELSSFLMDDKYFIKWSLFLGNLISVNLSGNYFVTYVSFFVIMWNCRSITEIKMADTGLGKNRKKVEEDSLMGLPVNSHVTVLCLARNKWLKDESVQMFSSICPSLETMDLCSCQGVSEGAVVEVLKRCRKISHLSLPYSGVTQLQVDLQVPTLHELNLSGLRISDEALSAISKGCCRLKQLDLDCCNEITAKGVKQVVENCKQLRVISLKSCKKVAADVVAWMVFARPSLRKIVAPPQFCLAEGQRNSSYVMDTLYPRSLSNVRGSRSEL